MARTIKLSQIADVMDDAIQELVQKTTLAWTERAKKATPNIQPPNVSYKTTGNLFRAWQTDIQRYKGTITNNTEYAEPVIYGTNLPRTWGGVYRTNQGTIKGFPELQAKQLVSDYIPKELARIINRT